MENLEAKTPLLNDLIQLNNDRIAGYENAIQELDDNDTDLKSEFHNFITQSYQFLTELKDELERTGGKANDRATVEGEFFRSWMDMKALFSEDKRRAILKSCIEGENIIYEAYDYAEKLEELPSDARFLLSQHKQQLKLASNKVITLYEAENRA